MTGDPVYVAFGVMFTSAGVFALAATRACALARRGWDAVQFGIFVFIAVYLAAHSFVAAGLPIA